MSIVDRKLPFKVSAKAARLIGRENVANAEGAIVELVKNTYDADADHCLIVLDYRFGTLPDLASDADYRWLSIHLENVSDLYEAYDGGWRLRSDGDEAAQQQATEIVASAVDLWIIDNGKGMSADIIERYWMVIGTNFKEENIFSDGGRVRTGAKGIGRFALDRLGATCEMYSTRVSSDQTESILWTVDWRAFEGAGKVLDEVQATLGDTDRPIASVIRSLSGFEQFKPHIDAAEIDRPWTTGAAICVAGLRDQWTEREVQHLYDSLASLVPPVERPPLTIYLFDARYPEQFGEVQSGAPSDFDYRLQADMDADGKVTIDVCRQELRNDALDDAFFQRASMSEQRYQKSSFDRPGTYITSVEALFPGANRAELIALNGIGPFKFSLLFYKRSLPTKDDMNRYPYRSFNAANRSKWLDKQGGIKIYRDDFIVRPYGEPDGKGFDWLRLGQRVSANPAAASRPGWRANPQSLAGTIKISRATNPGLSDQSNREGLIENETFRAFSSLIIRIIKEFEDDRSHILSNLNDYHKSQHPVETAKSQAKVVAAKIERSSSTPSREDAVTLAIAYRAQAEEIDELNSERGMLRALATLGTVLVSFSHEMGQLQSSLESRSSAFGKVLKRYITSDMLNGVPAALDPFEMLKDAERDDRKIKHWFNFALSSVKAGKRSRRPIRLRDHLSAIQSAWLDFLSAREVTFAVDFPDDYDPVIRALEIDLDSIFNNLILNSVEAFILRNHGGVRDINISVKKLTEDQMLINYTDTGPGVDASYRNVAQIFNFGETTKTGLDGNGTGIGMWILESVVKEYGGRVEAFRPSSAWGFKAEIYLPEGSM